MMNVLFMMMMKSDLLKIMVSVIKTNAIAMKFFKDAQNTSWTRRALSTRRVRTQMWRFYPGR